MRMVSEMMKRAEEKDELASSISRELIVQNCKSILFGTACALILKPYTHRQRQKMI